MFKNIGKKIQGYSMLVFVIEVFFSILAGVLAGATVQSVLWGDEAEVIGPGVGFLVIGAGIFLAWLGQMRLYAYGKIAESCEAMMKTMERMEAMQRSQIPMRKCANCGAELDDDAVFCPECGTKKREVRSELHVL